jgi:hypothetical protein
MSECVEKTVVEAWCQAEILCKKFLILREASLFLYLPTFCCIPYLRVYKQHFLTRSYPPKLGCGLCTEYCVLLTSEPATPVLYVVKLPVETASVSDLSCKLLHTRECANVLPAYRHILITCE